MDKIQEQLEMNALFEGLSPMASKRAAVLIGRFNPPTLGHYKVIDAVKSFIKKNPSLNLEFTPIVVIIGGSKSDSDKKRNPLSISERELFMKGSGRANGVIFMHAPNAFAALALVREKGFEPIAVAAGSDRIADYIRILDNHFKTDDGKEIKHHKISLTRDEAAVDTNEKSKVHSMDSTLSSLKDGDKIDTDVVSGSLARRAVELGYEPEFAKITGLEDKPLLAKKMFNKIAAAIKE